MIERQLDIATKDGMSTTFIVHPDRGGPHPVVVFLMDAPAIREELRDMARRLATAGYFVLLPNMYYRTGREGHYGFDQGRFRSDPAERKKMFDVMNTLSNARVVADTGPMLAFIRAQRAEIGRAHV